MTRTWQDYLSHAAGPLEMSSDVICLLLVHNEAAILPDFLRSYRAMGAMHFIVVDDRSTDGSGEMLAGQGDVTVFTPTEGSTYRADKKAWRGTLLDAFAVGKWCLTPDADERLVWYDAERRSLADLIGALEDEGAQALVADMVDMYDDRPLIEHVARGDAPLVEQFPYFDDPVADPLNYRRLMVPGVRFRRKFPIPQTESYGGMRDRMFGNGVRAHGVLGRLMLRHSIGRSHRIGPWARRWRAVEAKVLRPIWGGYPLVITKLAMVKWVAGMRFSGGPHHGSEPLVVSRERAAYLHFPITRGGDGIAYTAKRGQHVGGSKYYGQITEQSLEMLSPMYHGSKHFGSSRDLGPFIRGPGGKANE